MSAITSSTTSMGLEFTAKQVNTCREAFYKHLLNANTGCVTPVIHLHTLKEYDDPVGWLVVADAPIH